MSSDKLRDFKQKKIILDTQAKLMHEIVDIKRENISKDIENIEYLKKCESKQNYIRRLYGEIKDIDVNAMNDQEYEVFKMPLESVIVSGGILYEVGEQSKKGFDDIRAHQANIASLCFVLSTSTSAADSYYNNNINYIPNYEIIKSQHNIDDEINANIDFVRQELSITFPEIKHDFDAFIQKYHAFKSDNRMYQDLIGARSMLFFKLIFEFSKKKYGLEKPRKVAIEKFVFGNSKPDISADPIIKECLRLYNDLSNQDASGLSVKYGRVTSSYVDITFKRIIGSMAAILNLRRTYFVN